MAGRACALRAQPEGGAGTRNGFRPRRVQTAEGELRIEIPQVREAAIPFVSRLFPWTARGCCGPTRSRR